ncbi:hypothetical protein PG996_014443 [Apiospora saccharicola]|uniref:Uncharacterized protein n=1 Tax=Apiospora saccharicola TaxID=335842 RepID=A0ABR1TIB5_9PEZI
MSDDEQLEEELRDLSITLDSAIVLLRNEFKRHQWQEQKHAQALKEAPVFEDEDRVQKALDLAKDEPRYGLVFRQALQDDPRLRLAAEHDAAVNDVGEACVCRWLTSAIFEEGLRGVSPDGFKQLQDIEKSAEKDQNSKFEDRLTPNVCNAWRAQTYYSWTKTPQYQSDRRHHARNLATQLATGIWMFLEDRHDWDDIIQSLDDKIIHPGLLLMEQLATNKILYQVVLDTNPLSETLKADFNWEEYHNLTDSFRTVTSLEFSGPRRNIILGAICPGLTYRVLESDDTWQETKVAAKQERLVAWEEDLNRIISGKEEKKEPSLFSRIARGDTNKSSAS